MRTMVVLFLGCVLTLGMLGCGGGTPPPEEDTAANPTPEMMEIPPPDQLPAESANP